MASARLSFLEVVDHAPTMEHIRREAHRRREKKARYQYNYSGSRSKARDSYDKPCLQFQQGWSSQIFQVALPALKSSKQHMGGPIMGQSSRGSDSSSTGRGGQFNVGHSSQGCYD